MKYASSTTYYGRDLFDQTWGSQKLGEYGIRNRRGNCFVYAAILREIAVCMGYDAHQVYGKVRLAEGWGTHSWVEIDKDGETYVCDPACALRLGTSNAYMFRYGQKGTYMYDYIKRMN